MRIRKKLTNKQLLESKTTLLEYSRRAFNDQIKNKELSDRFWKEREKFKSLPEYKIDYWIENNKNDEELADFLDNYESKSEIKSNYYNDTLYEDEYWKLYFVDTYEQAQVLGKNTTWCITGRYAGEELKGEEYFNNYIDDYDLEDGYYFLFDKIDKSNRGDYVKYCLLPSNGEIIGIYNAEDDIIRSIANENDPKEKFEGLVDFCYNELCLSNIEDFITTRQIDNDKVGVGDIIELAGNQYVVCDTTWADDDLKDYTIYLYDDPIKMAFSNKKNCCTYEESSVRKYLQGLSKEIEANFNDWERDNVEILPYRISEEKEDDVSYNTFYDKLYLFSKDEYFDLVDNDWVEFWDDCLLRDVIHHDIDIDALVAQSEKSGVPVDDLIDQILEQSDPTECKIYSTYGSKDIVLKYDMTDKFKIRYAMKIRVTNE